MSALVKLNNGMLMPALGMGTWKLNDPNTPQIVRDAIALGYRHIDCALTYGNEKIVGEGIQLALKEGLVKREELFITSKLWNNDRTPERIKTAIQKTLSDLGIDYLDLYLIHWPINWKKDENGESIRVDGLPVLDTTLTIPEVYQHMEKLYESGLVKALGLSNFNTKEVDEVLAVASIKPVVNQVESHPLWNQLALQKDMEERGIVLTAYTPFAWKTPAGMTPLMSRPEITSLAAKYNKTTAQIVLRWQVQHNRVTIPKTSHKDRLAENLDIFNFKIEDEDMKILDNLTPQARHSPMDGFRCVPGPFFEDN